MRRSIWALSAAAGFLFLGAAGRAEAAGRGESSSFLERTKNVFFCRPPILQQSGESDLLGGEDVAALARIGRGSADNPAWSAEFLTKYFAQRDGGSAYDPTLAHWIVFIDSDGRVHQDLVDWSRTTCRAESRQELNGVNHVWVMLFSQIPMSSTSVRAEQLADYRGPAATLLETIARTFPSKNGVTDALGQSTPQVASELVASSDLPVPVSSISASTAPGEALYKGFVVVKLNPNSRDRMTLHQFSPPLSEKTGGSRLRGVHTNFVNGEPGHLGASIAAGGTRMGGGYVEPNLFVAAHYYFPSNRYWRDHPVPSAFVATNIARQSVLSDVVVGGALHNFAFSRALGVDVGGNFIEHRKGARLFVGLDFEL